MSGPNTEDPRLPDLDPEWLRRFNAKMADLDGFRERRHAERDTPEPVADLDEEVGRRIVDGLRRAEP